MLYTTVYVQDILLPCKYYAGDMSNKHDTKELYFCGSKLNYFFKKIYCLSSQFV